MTGSVGSWGKEPAAQNAAASLTEVIAEFRSELEHFISTDIVNISSGMSIGGSAVDPNFDASLASAAYADVVKSNRRALDLLGLGADTCEDILITTDNAFLLIRMLGTDHYHGLALGKKGTLGLARAIMKKYATRVLPIIRELQS